MLICSGEALPIFLVKEFYRFFPNGKLVNIYGSSEMSADVIYHDVKISDIDLVLKYFDSGLQAVKRITTIAEHHSITKSDIEIQTLKNLFSNVDIPYFPKKWEDYQEMLQKEVFPYLVNTASPLFIGHMTSVLPAYHQALSEWITMLNQNVVKIETSKSLTFIERQSIAMLHKAFYQYDEKFYQQYTQDPCSELGSVVSGGTFANIMAMWLARNQAMPKTNEFAGVSKAGIAEALNIMALYQRLFWFHRSYIILFKKQLHYWD